MDYLYLHSKRLLDDIQKGLTTYDSLAPQQAGTAFTEVQALIDQLVSNCERLNLLVSKEPPDRRTSAKLKADQLRYDCQHLQQSLYNLQNKKHQQMTEQSEREELLSRHRPGSTSQGSNDTSLYIDDSLVHNQKLHSANKNVDNMLGSSYAALENLRGQRDKLKGAHRRILDVVNSLGLSNTVMRVIERRTQEDRYIFYGLVLFTLLVICVTWYYFM